MDMTTSHSLTVFNIGRYRSKVGTRKVELGPVGHVVKDNIRRLREQQGLSLQELANRVTQYGRPIARSGLSKIEAGHRRVDVDDFVALAEALWVAPDELLTAPDAAPKGVDPAGVMLRVAAELTAAARVQFSDSANLTDAAALHPDDTSYPTEDRQGDE
jgi:transcriptional regulator with XRE-family HTH domain